jgi:hypothetical protein
VNSHKCSEDFEYMWLGREATSEDVSSEERRLVSTEEHAL